MSFLLLKKKTTRTARSIVRIRFCLLKNEITTRPVIALIKQERTRQQIWRPPASRSVGEEKRAGEYYHVKREENFLLFFLLLLLRQKKNGFLHTAKVSVKGYRYSENKQGRVEGLFAARQECPAQGHLLASAQQPTMMGVNIHWSAAKEQERGNEGERD